MIPSHNTDPPQTPSFPVLLVAFLGGCGREPGPPPFGVTPATSSAVQTTETSSGGGTTEVEASSASSAGHSGGTSGTTVLLDVGGGIDTDSSQPKGCQGKIDFLFVISRRMGTTSEGNGTVYERLIAAAPDFFTTIETKFADFDYHILVTDADPYWGSTMCNSECPGPFQDCTVPDEYPCEALGSLSPCDETWGAGVVFNAGWLASNKPCDISGGKRYLAKGQPNLAETFACLAQVGSSGYDGVGQALTFAVSPELQKLGGCNEGFLRDDALLMVTLVTSTLDYGSEGTPSSWAQAVLDAKGGDPDAVVMFFIGPEGEAWCEAQKNNRLCRLVGNFPHRAYEYALADDFGPAFDSATDLVDHVCASFIPG